MLETQEVRDEFCLNERRKPSLVEKLVQDGVLSQRVFMTSKSNRKGVNWGALPEL